MIADSAYADYIDIEYDDLKYDLFTSTQTATCNGPGRDIKERVDLVIPDYVEYDGYLYSVTTIGDYAFSECSGFTGSLTIPDSVTTIGDYAFRGCFGFTGSLTIPDSVITIGEYAFTFCDGFTGSLTIGNLVTAIGDYAFLGCFGFTGSLTIPDSVISIGYESFRDCFGFTGSLTIGNSVTTIGVRSFEGCYGFTGSLTIPDSVTTIGDSAFWGCSGLTGSLTIPDSITTIEGGTFMYCSGLTGSLTIPDSVTTIGDGTFLGCSGFTGELTIGKSVTTIGVMAFSDCLNIDNIISYNQNPPTCGEYVFSTYDVPLYVPEVSVNLYKNAKEWQNFYNISGLSEKDGPISIIITPSYIELEIGKTQQLEAILEHATPTTSIIWSSSDSKIATVSDNGLVTAIAEGDATITATCGDVSATCVVNVLPDAGVESLLAHPENEISIYSPDGILLKKDCKVKDLKTLNKGIYIIVSGKDRFKISI